MGWGIQFQSPIFLATMAGIVTLFAANLFGLFEITLPQSFHRSISGTDTYPNKLVWVVQTNSELALGSCLHRLSRYGVL